MRVVIRGSRIRCFQEPSRVLRAHSPDEVPAALAAAQKALAAGRYCAGYLSYELGDALRGAPRQKHSGLPLLVLGIFSEPRELPPEETNVAYHLGPLRSRVGRPAYDEALQRIAQAIFRGDVYQINYTVPFDFAFEGDPYTLFCELAEASRARYAAYVHDEELALLSISPELFVEIADGEIRAKPMKGTAPPGDISRLSTEKNRAEHLMIVDLLRNDLHRICSSVEVRTLFEIEEYPTFATMTSSVCGHLRAEVTIADLLRATFPCGSITGAPKRAAMDIIAQLEPNAREAYTGSVGYFAPDGTARWNVAIRTLQIYPAQQQGRLDIGGGIVADSSPSDEWAEIELKGRFIEAFTTPFELLETFSAAVAPEDLDAHLHRLQQSATHFGIPFDPAAARAMIGPHQGPQGPQSSLIRLRLDWSGALCIRTETRGASPDPASVCVVRRVTHSGNQMLGHKTSWRQGYEQALSTAHARGCFEALCTNERDELTEGTRTSLFLKVGEIFYTPPRSSGLLPGILRQRLLQQGRCREQVLYEEDLTRGAVYIGNSARGLLRALLTKGSFGA